ncbi:MAG: hypothetical protein HKN74_06795 [Acidimicrobiia bacterium]|nr:hypothetical protein [Acidimicrobiia bacterium]
MDHRTETIDHIRRAFAGTPHPGDDFLQGSREGRDAREAVEPFKGVADWAAVEPRVLDEHYDALSFLSEGGFRFFAPAYMVADLNDALDTADIVFHLTSGFHDVTVDMPVGDRMFQRRIGKSAFVNPRRYGAMTFEDYARYRLSVFSREEAGAIVRFLESKRPDALDAAAINAALDSFWLARAASAPIQASLDQHVADEAAFIAAINPDDETT